MTEPNIRCPACQSTASEMFREGVTDLLHSMAGRWELRECTHCGLIYTTPFIPESRIGEYYPADYAPYGEISEASAHPVTRFLKSLAILPYTHRFGPPGYFPPPAGRGRLLEVGCGAGRYLQKMSSLGWWCMGLDVSGQAIDAARKLNPATEFMVGTLDDIEGGDKFDLIVMHHVLEHLHHPAQIMNACFGMLQSGGKLVVSVPNIASWEARWFGRRWIGLDIPRHLLHFRESVLVSHLSAAGFVIEKTRPGMFASSISESVIMCLPAWLRRKAIHSRIGRVFYLMMVPVASITYALGNRGTVEIVAVKK